MKGGNADMNDKIFSHMSDPVKTKMILEIQKRERATTGQLAEEFTQIPQATLYRYLKKMLTDDIIKIVDEIPVRGTVEKVYALAFDFDENNKSIMEENDGKAYMQAATLYMLGILEEFKEYSERDDINLSGDGSGFSHAPIYATTEELVEMSTKIADIISPLMRNPSGGERKLRNICTIITPPKI